MTKAKTKAKAKVLNATCRTISVCKLLRIVNFDGLWTLMVWHFRQLKSFSTNQIIWTIPRRILIGSLWRAFWKCIEHAVDIVVRFGNKVCLKIWRNAWEIHIVFIKQMRRNTRLLLVFVPTLLSCSSRFLRALQQNRAQSRLLYF